MTLSIWRYSHLALAVSSFLFVVLASVTGIILAFEPISEQAKPYAVSEIEDITVGETIETLQKKYDEVLFVEVDHNKFVSASVITNEGASETFYINPKTGEKVGELLEQAPIFSFTTNLHRSLFLKSTGRFLVGVASFLLFLIAVTGVLLIIKRQGSVKRFFSKISNESFTQHYHVYVGRLFLVPIIIITLTGVYLSLEKFNVFPDYTIEHTVDFDAIAESPQKKPTQFSAFKNVSLSEVKRLEFPFSPAPEDYFIAKLSNKEILVNQITGDVLSKYEYPWVTWMSNFSLTLHTGRGSILWSIILLIASISILFFVYSGFAMTLKRRKKTTASKNKYTKDESEYIILVGSETGNTFDFAWQFQKALTKAGKKAFVSQLNNYTIYNNAKHVFVFTATYGQGEAPANATKFLNKITTVNQPHIIQFSVVGFGSILYEDYCQYAIDVDQALQGHTRFNQDIPLYKINNQDATDFEHWAVRWATQHNLHLALEPFSEKETKKKQSKFKVINKTELNCDDTFLLQLRPKKKKKFISGDLLEVIPPGERIARLYSIAKMEKDVLLSVKKHEYGVCSSYFNTCKIGDTIKGRISKNSSFTIPKKASEVLFISNGTGIAPFLGMIANNKKKIPMHLFWGGRTKESFTLYNPYIEKALDNKKLTSLQLAYSRESGSKTYVQDSLKSQEQLLVSSILNNGVVMICGSIAMQKDTLTVVETILEQHSTNITINQLEQEGRLLMDCY